MCVGAVGALRGADVGASGGGVAAVKWRAARGQALGVGSRPAIFPTGPLPEVGLGIASKARPARATANLRHTLTAWKEWQGETRQAIRNGLRLNPSPQKVTAGLVKRTEVTGG